MKTAYNPPLPPRPRRRRRPGRSLLFLAAAVIICLVAWQACQAIARTAARYFLKTETVAHGTLEDWLSLEVYIARDEELLVAPVTGTLKQVAAEGERVPAGAVIAYIQPVAATPAGQQPVAIRASFSGQVSYQTDGLEKALQPDSLGNSGYRELKRLVDLARPVTAAGQVRAGTACGRLVNNLAPLALYSSLAALPSGWEAGKKVTLQLPGSGEEVRATITSVRNEGEQAAVLMTLPAWDERWLQPRQMVVNAILNRYRGVIIPSAALVQAPGGETGVYIRGVQRVRWQPVNVTGRVGDRVAVDGLENLAEVIINPRLVPWL